MFTRARELLQKDGYNTAAIPADLPDGLSAPDFFQRVAADVLREALARVERNELVTADFESALSALKILSVLAPVVSEICNDDPDSGNTKASRSLRIRPRAGECFSGCINTGIIGKAAYRDITRMSRATNARAVSTERAWWHVEENMSGNGCAVRCPS
jgi:hypothetical protein